MIAVREAKDKDLPIMYGLLKEFAEYLDESEKMTITLNDFIECKNSYQCLLAEAVDSKEVVGCMLFYYLFDSWMGKLAYVDALYVKAELRGRSVGKLLMNALLAIAKRNKCSRVEWTVRQDNNGAIKFYQDFGASVGDDRLGCSIDL